MSKKCLEFRLSYVEQERLDEFKEKIKGLYGEYGHYTYKFSPTGIGDSIVVYSHLARLEKDITDDSW
jgi:hypothetical protein